MGNGQYVDGKGPPCFLCAVKKKRNRRWEAWEVGGTKWGRGEGNGNNFGTGSFGTGYLVTGYTLVLFLEVAQANLFCKFNQGGMKV